MNRVEFMRELTYLLQDVQDDERDEALKYYDDYFEEAGVENETGVIEELESPEKVAAIIKDGLLEDRKDNGEFSEKGFEDERFARKNEVTKRPDYMQNRYRDPRYGHYAGNGGYAYQNTSGQAVPPKKESSGWKIAAIVLICLFAIPIGVPVALGLAAAVFGVLIAAAAILFTLVVLCIVLLVVGIVMIGVGIAKMFSVTALGILVCGLGFLFVAFGLLGCIVTGFLFTKGIPACCRGISFLWRRLFGHNRKGYAA